MDMEIWLTLLIIAAVLVTVFGARATQRAKLWYVRRQQWRSWNEFQTLRHAALDTNDS